MIVAEARKTTKGALPVVVGAVLPKPLRHVLEEQEISYVDGRGGLHLVAPGLLLHVDQKPTNPPRVPVGTINVIGQTSIRALQVMLTEPNREWKLIDLNREGAMSLGQAHKLLSLLDREMLAKATGEGPYKRRTIPQPGLLLDWLVAQPSSRKVYEHLECTLYARSVPDLLGKVSRALDGEKIAYAWTGAAAAAILRAGPTSVPRAALRVDPDCPLPQVLDLLGAEPVDRGANLVLWRDTGRVGIIGAARSDDGLILASPIRVYLDLLGERRGEDAAAHFREVVIGF